MRPIQTFTVTPSLPEPLAGLQELAYNLIWTWYEPARDLFIRLDRRLWEACHHNPVRMLCQIDPERLAETARDEGYLAEYARVLEQVNDYLHRATTWMGHTHPDHQTATVAYFSAEFGLTECIPMYSGGLGNLAGDHLKSASDLGVPIVGVGLLYHQGYFRQRLNRDGWQQELFPEYDVYSMPLQLVRRPDGEAVTVQAELPGRLVTARIWRVVVGRVQLLLLDSDVGSNLPEDRVITDRLYGGDLDMRIRQEILLGIGGVRALEATGIRPAIFHMNEGHSAFLALERIRRMMEQHRLSFAEAKEAAAAGQVFTTHTPVPAGHDYFPPDMMDRYFGAFYRTMGLSLQEFMALGRQNPGDERESFCMTVLALRTAAHANGVSRLHGVVARRMWQGLWPGIPEDEIPIDAITNGIHPLSWISRDMAELLDRYLGPRWQEEPDNPEVWAHVRDIPDEELWRTHERRRERLVAFARRQLKAQRARRGATAAELAEAEQVLEPGTLTIGFARRFATYKRLTLLLQDPERLTRLLTDTQRPVQILVAGKAHPRDDAGKEMIRQILHLADRPELRRRLIFLEDYDINMARYLVQGADLWLNTPRRPEEASGTSGMKAAVNGVLNLSVLDGWWNEAYTPEVGWAIGVAGERPEGDDAGDPEAGRDPAVRDRLEAQALFDLLENEVVPTFYDRGADGIPRRWLARVKAAMATLCPSYNTHRMVKEYVGQYYVPLAQRAATLAADGFAGAKALALWKATVAQQWPQVRIEQVETGFHEELPLGESGTVRARVNLGKLSPDDVAVELYLGPVDPYGNITEANRVAMRRVAPSAPAQAGAGSQATAAGSGGVWMFEAEGITPGRSGLHGLQVRVRPVHPHLATTFETALIRWAG